MVLEEEHGVDRSILRRKVAQHAQLGASFERQNRLVDLVHSLIPLAFRLNETVLVDDDLLSFPQLQDVYDFVVQELQISALLKGALGRFLCCALLLLE